MVLPPGDEKTTNSFQFRIDNTGPVSAPMVKSIIAIKTKINNTMVITPNIKVGIYIL